VQSHHLLTATQMTGKNSNFLWTTFFSNNAIQDEERKKAILYTASGDYNLKTVLKQARSKSHKDLTYAEAINLLDRQLSPTPSSFLMRQRLKYREQLPNETAQMFLAELRVLAEGFEFPDADNILLGQFVSGISDQELKTQHFRLAKTNELTLPDAINRAVARETARAQVAVLPQQRQAAVAFHKATAYKKLLRGNPPEQKKQVQSPPAEQGSSGGRV
jgi:hypothetical protein